LNAHLFLSLQIRVFKLRHIFERSSGSVKLSYINMLSSSPVTGHEGVGPSLCSGSSVDGNHNAQRHITETVILVLTINSTQNSRIFIFLSVQSWNNLLSLSPVAPTLEHRASMKRFVSLEFLNPKTVGRTPWTAISTSQGLYLHKHRINADRHPCLQWDSDPRSQCSSERRQ
jgi:hypothetical protein